MREAAGANKRRLSKCPKRAPAEKQRPQDEGKANGHVFFLPAYRFPVFRERVRRGFYMLQSLGKPSVRATSGAIRRRWLSCDLIKMVRFFLFVVHTLISPHIPSSPSIETLFFNRLPRGEIFSPKGRGHPLSCIRREEIFHRHPVGHPLVAASIKPPSSRPPPCCLFFRLNEAHCAVCSSVFHQEEAVETNKAADPSTGWRPFA